MFSFVSPFSACQRHCNYKCFFKLVNTCLTKQSYLKHPTRCRVTALQHSKQNTESRGSGATGPLEPVSLENQTKTSPISTRGINDSGKKPSKTVAGPESVFQFIISLFLLYGTLLRKIFQKGPSPEVTQDQLHLDKKYTKKDSPTNPVLVELQETLIDLHKMVEDIKLSWNNNSNRDTILEEVERGLGFEDERYKKIIQLIERVQLEVSRLDLLLGRVSFFASATLENIQNVVKRNRSMVDLLNQWDTSTMKTNSLASIEDGNGSFEGIKNNGSIEEKIRQIEKTIVILKELNYRLLERGSVSREDPFPSSTSYASNDSSVEKGNNVAFDASLTAADFVEILVTETQDSYWQNLKTSIEQLSEDDKWKHVLESLKKCISQYNIDVEGKRSVLQGESVEETGEELRQLLAAREQEIETLRKQLEEVAKQQETLEDDSTKKKQGKQKRVSKTSSSNKKTTGKNRKRTTDSVISEENKHV